MKKALIILTMAALVVAGTGCKKAVVVSLMVGNWHMEKVTNLSGTDVTGTWAGVYQNYNINIVAAGTFTETYNLLGAPTTITGTWQLNNNETQLQMNEAGGTNVRFYDMQQLIVNHATFKDANYIFYLIK